MIWENVLGGARVSHTGAQSSRYNVLNKRQHLN